MEGFESIMKRAKKFPRRILADKGAEIKNKLFQVYCKKITFFYYTATILCMPPLWKDLTEL